jgi:hypothetical protein
MTGRPARPAARMDVMMCSISWSRFGPPRITSVMPPIIMLMTVRPAAE